jgi:iron complex outermembrane receptor protein
MMIKIIHKLLLTTVLTQLSCLAYSQSNNYGKDLDYLSLTLEELGKIKVSIATGNNTPIEQAPAVATVITARQIEAMGARTLDEVLETVPGLHVSYSGANRLDSIYSIRGIHTSFNAQVLLLTNGTPIQYSGTGGRPPLFRQPINNIAKIEIIRGPGSAIYGADAFSGVINIITKSVKDIAGNEIGSRSGSFGYQEAWVQTGKQYENWGLAFTVNYQHSNGDEERAIDSDLQTTLDEIYGTSASLAPGALSTRYEIFDTALALAGDHWEVNLRAWSSEDTGSGAGSAQALDPKSGDNYTLYSGDIGLKTSDWVEGWTNMVKLNYNYLDLETHYTILPPGSRVGINDDSGNIDFTSTTLITFTDGVIGNPGGTTEDAGISFSNIYEGIKKHRFRISAGSRYQSVNTIETKNFGAGVILDPTISPLDGSLTSVSNTEFVYLEDISRSINYISLQDEWNIREKWHLVTGLRYDKYSDFGDTTNPRIALVWQTANTFTSKLLYGSAFRAPSFGELGAQNNPAALGNKHLQPETIDTYELSLNYRPTSSFKTNISLYYYQAEDLIDYVFTPSAGGLQAQNVRDQDGYGLEWEASWEVTRALRINGSYAWQRSEDSDSGQDIADAPQQQLTLSTFWKIAPQWLLSNQINWVADRKRAANDIRSDIDDYRLVNLTLKRQNLYKNLDAGIGIRNVFDKDALEPSDGVIQNDFPLEGRSAWLELLYQF